MSDKMDATNAAAPTRRTTVVYAKYFALIGMAGGLALVFGTPGMLLLCHQGMGGPSQEWMESMPSWTAPTLLCIGMGGGVLITLCSACFGLLIPSRVVREVSEP